MTQKESDELQKQLSRPVISIEIHVKSSEPGEAIAEFSCDFGENINVGQGDVFKQEVPLALDKVNVIIHETGYKEWKRTVSPNKDGKNGKITLTAILEQAGPPLKKVNADVQAAPDIAPPPNGFSSDTTPAS